MENQLTLVLSAEVEQRELKIQTREMRLSKYIFAPNINRQVENMSDETFEIFFTGIEKAYNDKIEAEKKAEQERIAKEKATKAPETKKPAQTKGKKSNLHPLFNQIFKTTLNQ